MLYHALLLLHLLAVVAWVGGMFFAHFCLRPAAVEVLEPPARLPLMLAALRRFLGAMKASRCRWWCLQAWRCSCRSASATRRWAGT